jgi:hypothetical protein
MIVGVPLTLIVLFPPHENASIVVFHWKHKLLQRNTSFILSSPSRISSGSPGVSEAIAGDGRVISETKTTGAADSLQLADPWTINRDSWAIEIVIALFVGVPAYIVVGLRAASSGSDFKPTADAETGFVSHGR